LAYKDKPPQATQVKTGGVAVVITFAYPDAQSDAVVEVNSA